LTDVLDAFALVALVRDEPAAAEVEALLRRGDAAMTTTNLGEALDQLHRVGGQAIEELQAHLAPLIGGAVTLLEVDARLMWRAVELRGRHYRRRTAELSLADCVALAAAEPGKDRLATADVALAAAAQAEGVELIALPSSAGQRP
jgi:predicted nucleic acid-binding protein